MSSIYELIDQIGEKENSLLEKEFISPIFYNDFIATRICGLVYKFKISHRKPGWYKFRPRNAKEAAVVEEANDLEINSYLRHLNKIRFVLVYKSKGVYYGLPSKTNKYGFSMSDLLPVYLYDDQAMDFDQVICRYDGCNFWFESIDMVNDSSKGEYLREQLKEFTDTPKIRFSGLTLEEKIAYAFRFKVDKELVEDKKKRDIRQDVEHAGGVFVDFKEGKDFYNVTYEVDGTEYTSTISKRPGHQVITAGICLDGGDKTFDLKSLVTVMRENQDRY